MEIQEEQHNNQVDVLSKLSKYRVQFSELEFQHGNTSDVGKSMKEIIKSNPELLSTPTNESQALNLCFLTKYLGNFLPENVAADFQDRLPELRDQYPAIRNVESKIFHIQKETGDFFSTSGTRYKDEERNVRIKLPPNPIASLIVKTEAYLIQSRYRTQKHFQKDENIKDKYEEPKTFTPKVGQNELEITMTKKFKK